MGAKKLNSFLKSKANPEPVGDIKPRMIFLDEETYSNFEKLKEKNNLTNAEMMNALVDYILDVADHDSIEPDPEFLRVGTRLHRLKELKKLIDSKKISLSKIIRDVLKGKL